MNAYSSLARFYDSLTSDVPYDAFADFYESVFKSGGTKVRTILDLACGSGTMTHILAKRGYELIGADSSPDMLSVAAQKGSGTCIPPVFICQRMEELDLYGTVDAAVCSLDGINYVRPDKLEAAFRRVLLFLERDGYFVFDINTPQKLREQDGMVFLDENDDVFCVWRAEFRKNACYYGMDIFEKNGSLWRRFSEEHIEYAHEPDVLSAMLAKTGFVDVTVSGGPEIDESRVFITARK